MTISKFHPIMHRKFKGHHRKISLTISTTIIANQTLVCKDLLLLSSFFIFLQSPIFLVSSLSSNEQTDAGSYASAVPCRTIIFTFSPLFHLISSKARFLCPSLPGLQRLQKFDLVPMWIPTSQHLLPVLWWP